MIIFLHDQMPSFLHRRVGIPFVHLPQKLFNKKKGNQTGRANGEEDDSNSTMYTRYHRTFLEFYTNGQSYSIFLELLF